MKMKKLYALLVILIVLYIGINVNVNGFSILNVDDSSTNDGNDATIKDVSFPKLNNFNANKVNDTDIKYIDNNTGVTIELQKIDNTQNLSDVYNNLSKQNTYTSSQEIDQNGVTAYFLYNESESSYDADIFFNKNKQNFKISGNNISYENSDYFIKNCKNIIDSIGSKWGFLTLTPIFFKGHIHEIIKIKSFF